MGFRKILGHQKSPAIAGSFNKARHQFFNFFLSLSTPTTLSSVFSFPPQLPADAACRKTLSDPAQPKTGFARVLTTAETNSLSLLSELRAAYSPLDEVRLHLGIL